MSRRRKAHERKEQSDAQEPRLASCLRRETATTLIRTQPALLEQSKNNAKSGSWGISRQRIEIEI
jgi:hypothetical protein